MDGTAVGQSEKMAAPPLELGADGFAVDDKITSVDLTGAQRCESNSGSGSDGSSVNGDARNHVEGADAKSGIGSIQSGNKSFNAKEVENGVHEDNIIETTSEDDNSDAAAMAAATAATNKVSTAVPFSPSKATAGSESTHVQRGVIMSPNVRNGAGNTSLHLVAAACSLQGLDLLIQHGADLDAQDAEGRSALHIVCAASGGPDLPEDLVRRLLLAGSNPNLADYNGSTPLHVAAATGREACLQMLLEGGAVSQLNNAGDTPLHISAVHGHLGAMQRLVLWRPSESSSNEDSTKDEIDPGAVQNDEKAKTNDLSSQKLAFVGDETTEIGQKRETSSNIPSATLFGELIVSSPMSLEDNYNSMINPQRNSSPLSETTRNSVENYEYLSYSSDSTHGSEQQDEVIERPALIMPSNNGESQSFGYLSVSDAIDTDIDGGKADLNNASSFISLNEGGPNSEEGNRIPGNENIHSAETVSGERSGTNVWIRYMTADGDTYFYNEETDTSRWETPEEDGAVIIDPDTSESSFDHEQRQVLQNQQEYDYYQEQQHYEQDSNESSQANQSAWDYSGEYAADEYSKRYYDENDAVASTFNEESHYYGSESASVPDVQSSHATSQQDYNRMTSSRSVTENSVSNTIEQSSPGESKSTNLKIWNKFFENALLSHTGDNAEEAQQAAEDDTTFLNLVIAGDLKAAERMILSGTSASCVDDQLRTPLHYAAYNGDRDMAALLCDYDADIEAFDASGNTALHVSAARGTTRTLLFLLEYAAIVDVQNDVGDTPLHLATWFGNRECVRHLLNYSASLDILNSYGLDPYNNVFSRSPLARKKKLPSDLRKSLQLLVERMPSLAEGHTPGVSTPPVSSSPPVHTEQELNGNGNVASGEVEEAGHLDLDVVAAKVNYDGVELGVQGKDHEGDEGEDDDEGFESADEQPDDPLGSAGPPPASTLGRHRSNLPPPPPDVAAALATAAHDLRKRGVPDPAYPRH